ncbi:hypothetical protein DSOUD_3532 [Desulfuromonas soudanensis]|uniref:Permease n=1 Tax=Desulfuromonas soudanensis TaxID=1603606 RepID=A0A0M4D4G2_9BACT|nr:permease [Desulfuromonas soudanensis]ALC18246.1 hypothetical protein DSOUD_3532 [Desulfuromonas soudanensis]
MTNVGLTYLLLIVITYGVLFRISPGRTRQSLAVAGQSLGRLFPLLIAVFALIGLFQVYLPPEAIQQRLGAASGWSALVSGGLLGAVAIGPPVAAFPLAGSLLAAGAWPPAIAAFIVSWVSVGVISLPVEAEVFGLRFALARNGIAFLAALLIGLLVGVVA